MALRLSCSNRSNRSSTDDKIVSMLFRRKTCSVLTFTIWACSCIRLAIVFSRNSLSSSEVNFKIPFQMKRF